MKFIPIMEISGQIMTLIEEAEKELIIVSPYVDIKDWDKLKRCLNNAITRNIAITFYVRENVDYTKYNAKQNLEYLKKLNVTVVPVKDLHAKIYMNETYSIVSSQNLYEYSDKNSIDFAYSTETDEEQSQLLKLINKYLVKSESALKETIKVTDVETDRKGESLFKENELEKIKIIFNEKFPHVKINSTSTYLYCNELMPFADIMLKDSYEIRFSYHLKKYNELLKVLNRLEFDTTHYKYKRELRFHANKQPAYLSFIPQDVTDIQKLIYDYVFITQTILKESSVIKVEKKITF